MSANKNVRDLVAHKHLNVSQQLADNNVDCASEVERLNDQIATMWEENPDNPEICELLRQLGSYRVLQGAYAEASYTFKRLRQLLSQHYGPYDITVIETIDWIAVMEMLENRIESGRELLLNALAILSESPYPALAQRAKMSLHLGHCYLEEKRYTEAEERLKQAASFQLYWMKTGLANQHDRSLLCDIMISLRKLFVITERYDEVKEIDKVFAPSSELAA